MGVGPCTAPLEAESLRENVSETAVTLISDFSSQGVVKNVVNVFTFGVGGDIFVDVRVLTGRRRLLLDFVALVIGRHLRQGAKPLDEACPGDVS